MRFNENASWQTASGNTKCDAGFTFKERERDILLPLCFFTTKFWQLNLFADHRAVEREGKCSKLKVFCRVEADAPIKSSIQCHIFFYYHDTPHQSSKLVMWSEIFRTFTVDSQGSSIIRRDSLTNVKIYKIVMCDTICEFNRRGHNVK